MKKLLSDSKKLILIMIIPYIAIVVAGLMPIQYDLIAPGGINPVSDVIEIENGSNTKPNINTVYVYAPSRITFLEYLIGSLDHTFSLRKTSPYYIASSADESKAGQIQKNASINASLIVAYQNAGRSISYEYVGEIIDMVYSYTDPDIKIGDIVVAVNGHRLTGANMLEEATKENIDTAPTYEAEVIRGEEHFKFTVTKPKTRTKEGIPGFTYYEKYNITSSNPSYTIKPSNTGGPSGGLMQTLSIYATLTGKDLSHGKVIAGTGTIEHQFVNGVSTWIVGPIGGAYQKVIAAERAGVDVFFVPDDPATDEDNYTDALAAFATLKNSDMDIVPVRYFEDALEYLEGLHA